MVNGRGWRDTKRRTCSEVSLNTAMISKFFIHRPVFATVLSIVIVLAGLASLYTLPVEQYPEIVPPEIVVVANYPGASAQTIADSVAEPIEQQVNGVEDMIYMRSTSSDAGDMRLSVFFDIGTDASAFAALTWASSDFSWAPWSR